MIAIEYVKIRCNGTGTALSSKLPLRIKPILKCPRLQLQSRPHVFVFLLMVLLKKAKRVAENYMYAIIPSYEPEIDLLEPLSDLRPR